MRPVSPYRPGICRKCGCYTNGPPRCPYCGTYQPESGPRLQAEGTKPPVNGIAVAALITGGAAMMFGIFGVIALTGIILGIFGIVEANKRGQTGVAYAVTGIVLSVLSIILKTILLVSSVYLLWWVSNGLGG